MLFVTGIAYVILMITDGAAAIVICPSSTIPAEFQGTIYSPFTVPGGRLNCTLTLSNIAAGSWFGVFNDKFYIRSSSTGQKCRDQFRYLSISHPSRQTKYFCGGALPSVLYTAYSEKNVSVTFQLSAAIRYSSSVDIFQLDYKVARVIYAGRNGYTREQIQDQDSIVSHSTYPLTNYGTGINSSLILTNARLGSLIQLKFYKLDLAPNCSDYLQLKGALSSRHDNLRFCMRDYSMLNQWIEYTIVSTDLEFNFVSFSKTGGRGFRLDFRVLSGSGCIRPDFPHSTLTLDTQDSSYQTYKVTCNSGYYFKNGTDVNEYRITCAARKWFLLSSCTDKCKQGDFKCFYLCNVSSHDVNNIQCVADVGMVDQNGAGFNVTSVKTYVGVGIGIVVMFIVLIAAAYLLFYCRKHRSANKTTQATSDAVSRGWSVEHNDNMSHASTSSDIQIALARTCSSVPPTEETYLCSDDSALPKRTFVAPSLKDKDGHRVSLPLNPPASLMNSGDSNPKVFFGGRNLPNSGDSCSNKKGLCNHNNICALSNLISRGRRLKEGDIEKHAKLDHCIPKLDVDKGHTLQPATPNAAVHPKNVKFSKVNDHATQLNEGHYTKPNNWFGNTSLTKPESVDITYHLAVPVDGRFIPTQNPYHLPVPSDCSSIDESISTERHSVVEDTHQYMNISQMIPLPRRNGKLEEG